MLLVYRESGRNDVQWMEEIEADLQPVTDAGRIR